MKTISCKRKKNENQWTVCVFRPSPILLALDIEEDVARRAIRLSVGRETTQEDIDCAVNDLKQAVEKIQSKNTCTSAQRVE